MATYIHYIVAPDGTVPVAKRSTTRTAITFITGGTTGPVDTFAAGCYIAPDRVPSSGGVANRVGNCIILNIYAGPITITGSLARSAWFANQISGDAAGLSIIEEFDESDAGPFPLQDPASDS